MQGNSGSYLQYAYARAHSVLSKGTVAVGVDEYQGINLNPFERALVRKMTEYRYIIETASQELHPHQICAYLYELAQEFNRFYEKNRVIGDVNEGERLWLVSRYAATLKSGLEVLGIEAPEKM